MTVAAIVVTHRSEAHVAACLDSLQQHPPVDRIVVWDNGPTDGAADVAEASVPAATVIRSPENLGFAKAVNRASALVPADDLLLLNPDAVLLPGSVTALTSALANYPRLAVVGSCLVDPQGRAQPNAWAFPTPLRVTAGAVVGLGRAYRPRRTSRGDIDEVGAALVPFTAALVRRRFFDELGGLDEEFWMYGEDSEYCYRARAAGWSVAVARNSMARHVGGASSDPPMRAEAVLSGGDRFRAKHFSLVWSRVAAAALTAGAVLRIAWSDLASRVASDSRSREEWRSVRRHYWR